MKYLSSIIFVIAVTASFHSGAQDRREIPPFKAIGEPADQQVKEIQLVLEKYRRAWNQLDADTLSELHSQDTEWINAYARIFRGRKPLQEFLTTRLFPQFSQQLTNGLNLDIQAISIRYLSEKIVVAHLFTDFQLEGEAARRTHFHLVFEDQEHGWKIVHTAIMDAL